jgi:hypothetical protein
MAMAAVLPPRDAIDSILTIYEAVGVGNKVAIMQHLDAIQQRIRQVDHKTAELTANILALPPHWLASAASKACARLLWKPQQPLRIAVNGWTAVLAEHNPDRAFYAVVLVLVEQGMVQLSWFLVSRFQRFLLATLRP